MDELCELIDSRIKKVQDNTSLHSVPCVITDIYNDGYIKVKPVGSEVEYKALNYTAMGVRKGDNAILFYTGNILSNNGYIGAAWYDQNMGKQRLNVTLDPSGTLPSGSGFICSATTQLERAETFQLFFTTTVFGNASTANTMTFEVFIDGYAASSMIFNQTVRPNEYDVVSFVVPITLSQGLHEISVFAIGNGQIQHLNSHLAGVNLHAPDEGV